MKHSPEEVRRRRRFLHEERKGWPERMAKVDRLHWPHFPSPNLPAEVWRSKRFLCQVFDDASGFRRLSVSRCEMAADGDWRDGVTWDELMEVKRQVGCGDHEAVEVYPSDRDVVNVANIRHLWLVPDGMPFTWKDSRPHSFVGLPVRELPDACFPPGVLGMVEGRDERGNLDPRRCVVLREGKK